MKMKTNEKREVQLAFLSAIELLQQPFILLIFNDRSTNIQFIYIRIFGAIYTRNIKYTETKFMFFKFNIGDDSDMIC